MLIVQSEPADLGLGHQDGRFAIDESEKLTFLVVRLVGPCDLLGPFPDGVRDLVGLLIEVAPHETWLEFARQRLQDLRHVAGWIVEPRGHLHALRRSPLCHHRQGVPREPGLGEPGGQHPDRLLPADRLPGRRDAGTLHDVGGNLDPTVDALPASLTLLVQTARRLDEEFSLFFRHVRIGRDDVMVVLDGRQRERGIVVVRVHVGGSSDDDSPRGDPLPESGARVPLDLPVLGRATVMDEEHREHFCSRHHAQELRMIAKLSVIVRGRRRGPRKLVRDRLERLDERRSELGVVVLEDARFVEHDTGPRLVLKQVEPIVIRDDDGR